MKKKIIILCIIVIVIVLLVLNYNNTNKFIYKEKLSIEIGDKIPKTDKFVDKSFIKNVNNFKIEGKDINYHVGKYNVSFKYKNKKYKSILEVIDKNSPLINNVKDITIYKGEEVDLFKNIEIIDDSKDELNNEIIGEYDNNKVGEYELKYKSTDKGNNTTIEEFKLIVKDKKIKEVIKNTSEKEMNKTTSKGYTIEKINGIYYIDGILIANKTYSLPSSYNPGGLLKDFNDNFKKMKDESSKENIILKVISGYRSYERQNTLYNNYVNKDGKIKADTYSARAGHSEHQSGLAADINSLYQSFYDTKEGKWLNNNSYKYGFIIRYPKGKEDITGYIFEPWHIRYVGKDLAEKLYNNGEWITLEEYFGIDSKYSD